MRSLTVISLLSLLYVSSPAWAEDTVPASAASEAAQAAASVTAADEPSVQSAPATPVADPQPQHDAGMARSAASPAVLAADANAASAAKAEKSAVDPVALKKAGYKLVNEDGQQLYCREDLKTGSHLKKTRTCLTERELAALKDSTRREIEYMRTRSAPPQGK